jgi:predicted peptidase
MGLTIFSKQVRFSPRTALRIFTATSFFLLSAFASASAQDHMQFESRTYQSAKVTLVYRLYKPKAYSASAPQRYPIVVALHGVGERGADNNIQVDREDIVKPFIADSIQSRVPHFVMVPQCPSALVWGGSADVAISDAAAGVAEILDSLKREFILDTNRFYLTGLSMGGAGTYHLLKFRPNLFAAAVPCAASGDTSAATLLSRVPIWDFHGAEDGAVPVVRSRNMMAAFESRGIKVVRFVSQAPFNAPGMTAYSDAIKNGTNPIELVAKSPIGITYDSLRRAVAGGANILYTEVTGGDHRTGWMTAYHHPLMTPWLFSKVKGGGASVPVLSRVTESRSGWQGARLFFHGWAKGAGGTFSMLGRRVEFPKLSCE